mgnify:FL=1
MLPGDTEAEAFYETNLLGTDNGFGVLWSGAALGALMEIANNTPDLLEQCVIRSDMQKQPLTVQEFLLAIDKLKIR